MATAASPHFIWLIITISDYDAMRIYALANIRVSEKEKYTTNAKAPFSLHFISIYYRASYTPAAAPRPHVKELPEKARSLESAASRVAHCCVGLKI